MVTLRTGISVIYFVLTLLCLSLSFNSFLWGQRISYALKTYSTEQGLPSSQVKYITKDTCGFLWIATKDGLSRFDGYEFKNYFHDVTDSTSLPSYDLLKVLVGHNNHLWILGPNSISRFIRHNETFKQSKFN